MDQARYADALDPLSPRVRIHMGLVHFLAGRSAESIEQFKKILADHPNSARALMDLARSYVFVGEHELAATTFKKALALSGGGNRHNKSDLGWAMALSGNRDAARRILDELRRDSSGVFQSPLDIAKIYVGLGELDSALDWLEKAFETRDPNMVLLKVHPFWDPLRGSARYQDILRRMKFPL